MDKKILEVIDLEVKFKVHGGEVKAVRGVSYELNENETLAIVGESGSGKSVSSKAILGLLKNPQISGTVNYMGENLLDKTDKEMCHYRGKEFSMIFQDSMTGLNPTTIIGKQIAEAIRVHNKEIGKKAAKEKSIELLSKVGLPNPEKIYNSYPHTLSGGQRQRVMLAIALICNPKVLFADEPTTALDVTMQAQILKLMNELKKEYKASIVLITHDLGVVAQMADKIAVMYAGQIVEYGTADQIFYNASHPYTWGLMGAMPNMAQTVKEKLYTIPGTPPDMFAPPKGCAFAARCEYCMQACLKENPPEYPCSDGHMSRCWLMDERAEEVKPPEGVTTIRKKKAMGYES